jgi:BirA family biotin operon repressor/biotin-[acetyl-CoA-carboxylase] ligase
LYKKIPKTHFVGQTIKVLTSCPSTNSYINQKLQKGQLKNGEVIITDNQTEGRGQRGNVWESQFGKNLTFSVGIFDLDLPIIEQFRLHFVVALALVKTINENTLVKATIKWPNDIFIGDKKIAGILIENNIRKSEIYSSVIGIGLNVNQLKFETINATSLAIETQQEHFLDEVLASVLENIEHYLFRKEDKKALENLYLTNMYRLNCSATFEDEEGKFEGVIRGLDSFGMLQIEKQTGLRTYNFKEVTYVI